MRHRALASIGIRPAAALDALRVLDNLYEEYLVCVELDGPPPIRRASNGAITSGQAQSRRRENRHGALRVFGSAH
jgi:hypothetical protein